MAIEKLQLVLCLKITRLLQAFEKNELKITSNEKIVFFFFLVQTTALAIVKSVIYTSRNSSRKSYSVRRNSSLVHSEIITPVHFFFLMIGCKGSSIVMNLKNGGINECI